ncbi:MAG: penicillin acylase family protein, partial [Acidobacteria bacterium]|nr:penicillin acylase family protein [Acidobacteriota bacterium]
GHPRRAEMRRLVKDSWTGRASIDSTGYLLVREFRSRLADQVLGALTAPCRRADPDFSWHRLEQWEGPLWRLVTEQPPNLLPPGQTSWEGQLLAAADAAISTLTRGGKPLAQWRWGVRNTTRIRHPLSRALPLVGRWLDMAPRELPGDHNMPRVQAPAFGASERMVVSPGHEERGLFHMPCGESGNPISRHYRDGQAAWEEGLPTSFLPGAAEHTMVLAPAHPPSDGVTK